MKRMVWVAAALAYAASVSTVARDAEKVTVSGCVMNFSSTGESGVTERGFLLSNTTVVKGPSDGAPIAAPSQGTTVTGTPTGTSGTAAPGMPASGTWAATTGTMITRAPRTKTSYRLDGSDAELKEQVGHKVEVEGTIESGKDAPKSDTERLQVSAVRLIASDCSK
jgi:hypothetical protein